MALQHFPAPAPIDSLVDELLLDVFSRLEHAALLACLRVNRRWRNMALDNSLWTDTVDLRKALVLANAATQRDGQETQTPLRITLSCAFESYSTAKTLKRAARLFDARRLSRIVRKLGVISKTKDELRAVLTALQGDVVHELAILMTGCDVKLIRELFPGLTALRVFAATLAPAGEMVTDDREVASRDLMLPAVFECAPQLEEVMVMTGNDAKWYPAKGLRPHKMWPSGPTRLRKLDLIVNGALHDGCCGAHWHPFLEVLDLNFDTTTKVHTEARVFGSDEGGHDPVPPRLRKMSWTLRTESFGLTYRTLEELELVDEVQGDICPFTAQQFPALKTLKYTFSSEQPAPEWLDTRLFEVLPSLREVNVILRVNVGGNFDLYYEPAPLPPGLDVLVGMELAVGEAPRTHVFPDGHMGFFSRELEEGDDEAWTKVVLRRRQG